MLTVIRLSVAELVEDVVPGELGSDWLISGDGWSWVSSDSVELGRIPTDAVGGVMLEPIPGRLFEGIPSVSRVFANISV
jgi:hypothetical protein